MPRVRRGRYPLKRALAWCGMIQPEAVDLQRRRLEVEIALKDIANKVLMCFIRAGVLAMRKYARLCSAQRVLAPPEDIRMSEWVE